MQPETMLEMQSDMGVKPLSERARRVMMKYSGGAAPPPPKAHVEPVLLAAPTVLHQDAPLQVGELRAKRIKEMANARSLRTLGQAFQGWHTSSTAAIAAAAAARPKSSRVRAIAAVREARKDMPASLGGDVGAPEDYDDARGSSPPELEAMGTQAEDGDPDDVAAASRRSSMPELEAKWAADVEDWYEDGRAFCVRYSADGTLLAAGCGDGSVRILHSSSGRVAYTLRAGGEEEDGELVKNYESSPPPMGLPVTCVRWTGSRTLLAASAGGTVEAWKAGPSPSLQHTVTEEGNQIYCLAHSGGQGGGGGSFATAGRDTCVRLYDERTMRCVSTFGHAEEALRRYEASTGVAVGHTNRVFSLRFVPNEPDLLISGGWDRVVRLWDMRSGEAVRTIPDAHICGDSLDVSGHELLVGTYGSPDRPLQIFDIRSGALLRNVRWDAVPRGGGGEGGGGEGDARSSRGRAGGAGGAAQGCRLYAAQFSDVSAGLCAVGGVDAVNGTGEIRVFRRDGLQLLGRAPSPHGVTALDVTSFTLRDGTAACRITAVSGSKISMYEAREAAEVS